MTEANPTGSAAGSSREQARRLLGRRRQANLARMQRVVVVMSGKGGVGKSTVAASLALVLGRLGHRTGLLDVDFHGPTIPMLLGITSRPGLLTGQKLRPIQVEPHLRMMSLALLLERADGALIWRGPMKIGVIDQLLGNVEWEDLDFLVIDCPPGTGDEPLSIAQTIPAAEVVMVGTPQEVAMADVRKALDFCMKLNLRVLGLVETMSSMRCPACGKDVPLFRPRPGSRPAGVPLLAEIPFEAALQSACDEGRLPDLLRENGPAARRLAALAERIVQAGPAGQDRNQLALTNREGGFSSMRYAIPTVDSRLATHFGHAECFTFVDVRDGEVVDSQTAASPEHAPGLFPRWLKENGVNIVISGGMGRRAQQLLAEHGLEVVVGAPPEAPEALVQRHLAGDLVTGDNVCDH